MGFQLENIKPKKASEEKEIKQTSFYKKKSPFLDSHFPIK